MKKTLLIFTLFIGLGSANAQYDATWDETTTFIQTYSHEMYNYNSASCESGYNELSIKGKVLIAKFKFRDGSGEVTSKVDLSKLKKVTSGGYFFDIELTGDFIESSYDDGNDRTYRSKKLNIQFCNLEVMDRVYKAFEHLTKLATEKRGS